MIKTINKKLASLLLKVQAKASGSRSFVTARATENKGSAELVAVIVMIVIVLVVASVMFIPGLKGYFTDVFSGMKTSTEGIFNYKG